jgi:hypothetical protein
VIAEAPIRAALLTFLAGCSGPSPPDDEGDPPNLDVDAPLTDTDATVDTDATADTDPTLDTDVAHTSHTGFTPVSTAHTGRPVETADTGTGIATGDTAFVHSDSDSDSGGSGDSGTCGHAEADCGYDCPPGTYCAECISTYCDSHSGSGDGPAFCIVASCMPCATVC